MKPRFLIIALMLSGMILVHGPGNWPGSAFYQFSGPLTWGCVTMMKS